MRSNTSSRKRKNPTAGASDPDSIPLTTSTRVTGAGIEFDSCCMDHKRPCLASNEDSSIYCCEHTPLFSTSNGIDEPVVPLSEDANLIDDCATLSSTEGRICCIKPVGATDSKLCDCFTSLHISWHAWCRIVMNCCCICHIILPLCTIHLFTAICT